MQTWKLDQEIVFDGRVVRYGVQGSGPPLVMVHGTPWSSFNLRHLIAGLSADYTVYFFDLLGYGRSDQSEGDVSLGIQNKVLGRLLDRWQLDCPVIIGHDFGGATVLRSHLLDGRPFEKIVLIDAVAISPWGSPFFAHVRQHEAAFAGVPDYIHEAIVRAYVKGAAHQRILANTMDAIVAPWTGALGRAAFYRQIAQADSAYTDAAQKRLGEIAVPVLILWGAEDTWIPMAKAQTLHQLIPGSKLVGIADAGHLVIEERPAELIREIRAFLGDGEFSLKGRFAGRAAKPVSIKAMDRAIAAEVTRGSVPRKR